MVQMATEYKANNFGSMGYHFLDDVAAGLALSPGSEVSNGDVLAAVS